MPAINGNGLERDEMFRVNGARNRARAAYARDMPEATPGELDAMADRAAGDALRAVLRARPAAPELVAECCSPAEPEPCLACTLVPALAVAGDAEDEDRRELVSEADNTPTLAEVEAAVDADIAYRSALIDRLPLPFISTTHDVQLNTCLRRGVTLDQFLAAEAHDVDPDDDEDRVVWRGGRVLAVIRPGRRPGRPRNPVVIRFDAPDQVEVPTLTLAELIDQEAARLRRMETAAGDLMSRTLAELAHTVRFVQAKTPGDFEARMEVLERDAVDLRREPELMPSGRWA